MHRKRASLRVYVWFYKQENTGFGNTFLWSNMSGTPTKVITAIRVTQVTLILTPVIRVTSQQEIRARMIAPTGTFTSHQRKSNTNIQLACPRNFVWRTIHAASCCTLCIILMNSCFGWNCGLDLSSMWSFSLVWLCARVTMSSAPVSFRCRQRWWRRCPRPQRVVGFDGSTRVA